MGARKTLKSKVCLVGEVAVGKSSLISRYVANMFDDRYIMTIGTKISKKTVDVSLKGANASCEMTIWDIMGGKGFRQLLKGANFSGPKGTLAGGGATRPTTREDLQDWIAPGSKGWA